MSKNTKYNKSTYIGFLKMKKGGMKIIPGEMDTNIINERNKILSHLDLVLGGQKKLKEKNVEKYFKALGGKYVRNDICSAGDSHACKLGKKISLGGADKLLKLCAKKDLPMDNILNKFKGSSPSLYEKLEQKITGGKGSVVPDNISVVSNNTKSHSISMGGHNIDNNSTGGYKIKNDRYHNGGDREVRERELLEIRNARNRSNSYTCNLLDKSTANSLGWVGINMNDEMIGPKCPDAKEHYNLITRQTLDERVPTDYELSHPNEGIVGRRRGGYHRDDYENNYENNMYGGQDIELNNFRSEIGRLSIEDELNKLRLEIKEIRNN
jgi:hypothetical protein